MQMNRKPVEFAVRDANQLGEVIVGIERNLMHPIRELAQVAVSRRDGVEDGFELLSGQIGAFHAIALPGWDA
jgi:hypothetical protein